MTDQQNGILNHPAIAFLSIVAIFIALPADLVWWLGKGPAWVAGLCTAIGAGAIITRVFKRATKTAVFKPTGPAPQPAPAIRLPTPTLRVSQYGVRLEDNSPGTFGQHFYKEAFEAMARGTFVDEPYKQFFQIVGQQAQEWVNSQYQYYVERYPGMRGETLLHRLYATLYREIRSNGALDSASALIVVPTVDKHVAGRFAREIK